jgi:hypothetical protein
MRAQINSKIVSYQVLKAKENEKPELEFMHESVKRPEVLMGTTYKIRTPQSPHALYLTINDMLLNEGTEYESRVPFELFLNSKAMDSYQWIIAITRLMSSMFRKGGNVAFIVDELKVVHDPAGGFWEKGKYYPSLVAKIGSVIELHLKHIGMIQQTELEPEQKQFIASKRAEFEALHGENKPADESISYPEKAVMCTSCNTKAMVLLDGCLCCLSCGFSKCG